MHAYFLVMGFGWLLFVIGLVALVLWAIRAGKARPFAATGPTPPPAGPAAAPLGILARRFAAGEINAEDYVKARDLLDAKPTTETK